MTYHPTVSTFLFWYFKYILLWICYVCYTLEIHLPKLKKHISVRSSSSGHTQRVLYILHFGNLWEKQSWCQISLGIGGLVRSVRSYKCEKTHLAAVQPVCSVWRLQTLTCAVSRSTEGMKYSSWSTDINGCSLEAAQAFPSFATGFLPCRWDQIIYICTHTPLQYLHVCV